MSKPVADSIPHADIVVAVSIPLPDIVLAISIALLVIFIVLAPAVWSLSGRPASRAARTRRPALQRS